MSEPKILIVDIETSPMIVYSFQLYDVNLSEDMIIKDWEIMSYSAKWLGEKKVYQADKRNERDDKKLVAELWKLMDEADIIVGQNSKKFDIKKINARMYFHGMNPPSSYRQLDTKIISKSKFAFSSHGLAFMSKMNKKFKKSTHKKFPGILLWTEALAGNKQAWDEMAEYNKIDVLATEETYKQMEKWDNSLNFGVYYTGEDMKCKCGSKSFHKDGHQYLATGKYIRYRCKNCGNCLREPKPISKTKYRTCT